MEVDDGQPPASPVSPREDELLTGSGAVGVEGKMAHLKVSSPRGQDGGDFREALPASAYRMPTKKGQEPLPWNVEDNST